MYTVMQLHIRKVCVILICFFFLCLSVCLSQYIYIYIYIYIYLYKSRYCLSVFLNIYIYIQEQIYRQIDREIETHTRAHIHTHTHTYIFIGKVNLATVVEGDQKISFYSSYTEVLFLDCSTLPLIRTLYCWVLSKDVSSTIFKVLGMMRTGIEPRSPGPLANTLSTRRIWSWPIVDEGTQRLPL